MYGESPVTDRTCQKWFVKFCAREFSLDTAPGSGTPVEVDSNQIKTLIDKYLNKLTIQRNFLNQ